ncbi:MAG TPA: HAMP domain-containing sensor histidine kinase [Rhodopila sp.]
MFRFLNVSRMRERARAILGFPWPLTARVPIVAGALILTVAIVVSHVMMDVVAREQEEGVRQTAAVYLDGISTTIYPHVAARNLANTTEALYRTMWFHQGMQEQRALVRLPDGSLFADVSGPDANPSGVDPVHDQALSQRLQRGGGFVFDETTGTGWASRSIVRDGRHVADLYVALELRPLLEERLILRNRLLAATVLAGLAAGAIGFLIVRRMVMPVRLLTDRLRRAQGGDLEPVPDELLPSSSSEYGRLLRGYNGLVGAFLEREALAARLALRERESMLGRLAATVAHEVRNPLGGMSTALDTVRKFGDDRIVRGKALDLIERGLWSIRDVVQSVLAFHRMPPDGRKLLPADLDDLGILIEREVTRRQLRLHWVSSIDKEVAVAATETRQVALNLLLNACEVSPPRGEISFDASIAEGPAGLPELMLVITDAGPGIPPRLLAALTGDDASDGADPQSGIGLRVIRDLVRALGGRIVVVARQVGGTCVTVSLPIDVNARQAVAA